MDRRDLQRLDLAHRRQDSRKARREHRFARARRPDHEHTVSARGGDFERALGLRLAFHFAEIRVDMRSSARRRLEARQLRLAAQMRHHLQQRSRRKNVRALGKRSLGRIALGHHERTPGGPRLQCHGKRAAHRAQLARERKLTYEFMRCERLGRDLTARRQYAERNRQIEAAGILGQIGRRKIDRDAARGKLELRVVERGAHAILGLAHLGIG